MSDIDRREFLLKAVQTTASVLTYFLAAQKILAEETPAKAAEPNNTIEEDFWVGGY